MKTVAMVHGSTLRQRGNLPEDVICLSALGDGAVAVGTSDGVQVVSLDGGLPVHAMGFIAQCLVPLGSQTLAGGNNSGCVCIWHWRRRTLKQVMRAEVHANCTEVRCLANGGDVLLTASEDGTARQIDVLEDWAQSDFFSSGGVPLLCVAFCGRHAVLIGCEDGRILEVSRRNAEVMRRMDLGAPVQTLDADDHHTGSGYLLVHRRCSGRFGTARQQPIGGRDGNLFCWPSPRLWIMASRRRRR